VKYYWFTALDERELIKCCLWCYFTILKDTNHEEVR
jgi:hypothetical protein